MQMVLDFLHSIEPGLIKFSESVWLIFIVPIIVMGAIFVSRTLFVVKNKTTKKASLSFKNFVGPASIALGAMIGTGAIVGVIGVINKYSESAMTNGVAEGLRFFESIAGWAFLVAIILVPISYCEALSSKIMKMTPRKYIDFFLGKSMSMVYGISFVALAVFGFGGFQFSGIDSVGKYVAEEFMGVEALSLGQRFLFFVLPVLAIVGALILSKKHSLFMNAMTFMIGIAVVGYFLFFGIFVFNTMDYVPTFFSNLIAGMSNPVTAALGVPLGIILGAQKVIQTAETGLGALAMAVQESDSEPREAGMIALFPTMITVFVSIFVTTYIVSYGASVNIFQLPNPDSAERLGMYFQTANEVVPIFGAVVLCIFTVFSALTTILGSFYYLGKLFPTGGDVKKENKNIIIYLALIIIAAILAVFGAAVVFEAVDLLLLVLIIINLIALCLFSIKGWKKHIIK